MGMDAHQRATYCYDKGDQNTSNVTLPKLGDIRHWRRVLYFGHVY